MADSVTVADSVDSVVTMLNASFESNILKFSALPDVVTESSNMCSFNHKVCLTSVSVPVYMTYVFIAGSIFVLSVVLNALVIRYYRKPQTCNRIYVFGLVFRDLTNVIFKLLPLLSLLLVQECRLLLSFYNFWVLTFCLGLVFEFTPGCFIILDRYYRLYEPRLVNFFFYFKCFYLIFHGIIFGLYICSVYTGIKFAFVEDLMYFALGVTLFVWLKTAFVMFGFNHKILKKTEIESSNSQDAAVTPG